MRKKRGVAEDIKSVWYLLISKRMIKFLPQILYGGIVVSITTGMLVPITTDKLVMDDSKKS